MMVCSSPADCAEIERRPATGVGLLADGGASRGNLLSGEAEECILTVSRTEAEKRANPGYRAFLANGFNVTRALVLFAWEVALELTAALRAARRDVRPRGHRGGSIRSCAARCAFRARPGRLRRPHRHDAWAARGLRDVRQLRRGRAPLRPGGADTLEALRKLDEQFGASSTRADTPRGRMSSSSSPTTARRRARVQAAQRLRARRARARSLTSGEVAGFLNGDEQHAMVGNAVNEAPGQHDQVAPRTTCPTANVVLGSGNLASST